MLAPLSDLLLSQVRLEIGDSRAIGAAFIHDPRQTPLAVWAFPLMPSPSADAWHQPAFSGGHPATGSRRLETPYLH